MSIKCQICNEQDSKYKCPKCGIRYCSLICFKDAEKHVHDEQTAEQKVESKPSSEKVEQPKLKTAELDAIHRETPEIQELLTYNTVKFHLAKVYRILGAKNETAGSTGMDLSSEAKQQLAVDYLNALRYGGVHFNEAIEEFCQISAKKLDSGS
ncbi:LAFA_0E03620g1_1 [Lachancea sp. 'fantastica']|nr:LAFA_0E03620g1_1 [Lachancea sp. 'fantastica']